MGINKMITQGNMLCSLTLVLGFHKKLSPRRLAL